MLLVSFKLRGYTMPEHYLAFQVKYLGPTNYRGARVKLTCSRLDWQKIVAYDFDRNGADGVAEFWLTDNGVKIVGHAEVNRRTVFLADWESGLAMVEANRG
jgi:hypothetical protein